MVALMVIVTVIAFLVVDVGIRLFLRHRNEARLRRERAAALDIGLKLDVSDEAPSLKRAMPDNPKARILAVDDEPIILDSFRKILVLDGYAIDTVESGPEALGLVKAGDYDFVFTDLKMPIMDGLDVVKGVKHLRPDVDVIVITGFATIETAVDCMKYGAMDYVQKPFTAEELVAFVGKSLIRRQDKLERSQRPHVRIVTPSRRASASPREFNVPSGLFIAEGHAWVGLHANGLCQIGVDDFIQKLFGTVESVDVPDVSIPVMKGDRLFSIVRNGKRVDIPAPVTGKVVAVNAELDHHPELVNLRPFESGWVCWIEPARLATELSSLRIGADAEAWYDDQIARYEAARQVAAAREGPLGERKNDEESTWEAIQKTLEPA